MFKFDHTSGEHLRINGTDIYYEVTGNEKQSALLFLHGGFGTMEDFNGLLPELGPEFRIIGIDSRGHGKSTLGSEKLTYQQIQEDVERILDHLHIDNLSIIGFSDGGIVAYRLAAITSLNIEKLITIGSDWHFKNTEPVKELFLSIFSARAAVELSELVPHSRLMNMPFAGHVAFDDQKELFMKNLNKFLKS